MKTGRMKTRTLAILRNKAIQGDAEAQFFLGEMHCMGNGAKRNFREAKKWYQMAAAQGHSSAQYELGWMYLRGEGARINYRKAVQMMRRVAESTDQGFYINEAKGILGEAYEKGLLGLRVDYKRAAAWYRSAAREDPKAMLALGLMYLSGDCFP